MVIKKIQSIQFLVGFKLQTAFQINLLAGLLGYRYVVGFNNESFKVVIGHALVQAIGGVK